jgi:Tfp pilus assembly protein PilZ
MKIVGYMEGTNSELLTNLFLEGYETLPLSNGWDNHGKYIAHVNRTDNLSLVVGYLHKFIPVSQEFKIGEDILSSLKIYKIPTVFIVPKNKQSKAEAFLKGKGVKYHIADPGELTKAVMTVLKKSRKNTKKKSAKKK